MRSRRAPARRRLLGIAFALTVAALAGPGQPAAQTRPPNAQAPSIPSAIGFVNDRAEVMDEPTRAKLEGFLVQVKRVTGAEFAVLTVRTTAPWSPSDYKVRVFERWGLGARGHDNGLLMLVALEEREVRFETGYGLEGTLPDGLQSRIFRNEIAPRFKAGDYGGGIIAGVLACAGRIAAEQGATLEWDGREVRYRDGGDAPAWPMAVILVMFLVLMIVARRAGWTATGRFGGPYRGGMWMGGSGGFGGGFGGGGSFGGGGGSFGGFGGGASGGGGGGGKW